MKEIPSEWTGVGPVPPRRNPWPEHPASPALSPAHPNYRFVSAIRSRGAS